MRKGQEVHDAVVFRDGHALAVGFHSRMVLSVGENDTFGIACRAAGIENIGDFIEAGRLLQVLNLALSGQTVAQFHEVIETHGGGVVFL